MLSKLKIMPSDNKYSDSVNSYSIEPRKNNSCQEVEIWKTILSNGKTVNVEIGRLYDMGKFTLELDQQEYDTLINNCNSGTIIINDFDYNIDYVRNVKDIWVEVNGIPLKACNKIPDINSQEKMELYRIIYKWDIIARDEKSSGSESNSDSDFDEQKLTHNNCIHLTTKYAIINGFDINEL